MPSETFTLLHDLIFSTLPPMPVRIGPAEVLVTIGLTWAILFELRTWRKHR